MRACRLQRSVLTVVSIVPLVALISADSKLSRQQAESFSRKIDAIAGQGEKRGFTTRTPVTEGELNSWMVYTALPLLPSGVAEPSISIIGNGRLAGRVMVDLDAVSKQKSSGGALDPW